jgi:o-succinylbenzoate synthase
VQLEAVELVRVWMPLVRPFRTSFGTQVGRDVLLVHTIAHEAEGWGECVALGDPIYNSEFVDGAELVLRRWLIPALLAETRLTASKVRPAVDRIKGHQMAKAAIELAVLDAQLKAVGMPLSEYLGGVRDSVETGVSIGITDTVEELLEIVANYLSDGYRRVKLKIEPGWDVTPVRAVREQFGDDLVLQVDGNAAYRRREIPTLLALDPFNLALVEQPFAADDLASHVELAHRASTPICLDESIESASDAVAAIGLGACDIVNVKAGRVGGYLEARRIHDVCSAMGVPVWCGGMLETGLGRAANVALASLPNFQLPGDISASNRYYAADLTEPFELVDSSLTVPVRPGLGVMLRDDVLVELAAKREMITAS